MSLLGTDARKLMHTKPLILLIAYGNSLRQDDGAGLVLADQLAHAWPSSGVAVQMIQTHQLVPELAEDIAHMGASAVVFIDTRDAAAEPGRPAIEVRRLTIDGKSAGLGHHFDPETLLAYAYQLYDVQLPAWLATVPGLEFGHGEGVSQVARTALASADAQLGALPDKITAQMTNEKLRNAR